MHVLTSPKPSAELYFTCRHGSKVLWLLQQQLLSKTMRLNEKFASVYASCPGVDFDYDRHKPLFKNVDFGIDMESRSECVPLKFHHQHLK